jgi:hypothetical protein
MLGTQEEIVNFINFHKEFVNSNKEKILTSDEKLKSRWLWGLGTNAQAVALGYSMLNDRNDALIWFNKSAEFYFQCMQSYDKTKLCFGISESFTETIALQVMKSIVLSGNKNFINELSNYTAKNKPEISMSSDLIFNYVIAASMIIITRGERLNEELNEELKKQLKKLSESEEKHGEGVIGYYAGTSDAMEGLAENNKEKILNGINKMLFSFGKYLSRTKDIPLCIDAVMILLIAKNKEIEIDIQEGIYENYQKYIPLYLSY